VHIPKTGGTSIEHALGIFGDHRVADRTILFGQDLLGGEIRSLQHLSLAQISDWNLLDPLTIDEYFSFALVRNPWDRAVSDYAWRRKKHRYSGSFEEYLLWTKSVVESAKSITKLNCHQVPQNWYTHSSRGECLVDFVGRFESIGSSFAHAASRIGVPADNFQKLNSSDRAPYYVSYSRQTAALVSEIYESDINLFGYRFLDGARPDWTTIRWFVSRSFPASRRAMRLVLSSLKKSAWAQSQHRAPRD
jgi:hypothetical protein